MYPPEAHPACRAGVSDDVEIPWLHLRPDARRAFAIPLALALTASLGFLPDAASAATAASASGRGGPRRRPDPVVRRQHQAGPRHDRVGRAGDRRRPAARRHRLRPDRRDRRPLGEPRRSPPRCATVRGVQSAGATRTAPLTARGDHRRGRGAGDHRRRRRQGRRPRPRAGQEPLEPHQWDLPAIRADKAARINPGSKQGHRRRHRHRRRRHPPGPQRQLLRRAVRQLRGRQGRHQPRAPGGRTTADALPRHARRGEIAAARNGDRRGRCRPGREGRRHQGGRSRHPACSTRRAWSAPSSSPPTTASRSPTTATTSTPGCYNCTDDPDQRAIVDAVNRAAQYAQQQGRAQRRLGGQLQPRPGLPRDRRTPPAPTTPPRSPGPSTRTSASTSRPSCRVSSPSPRPASRS